jgi:hypothetical protein
MIREQNQQLRRIFGAKCAGDTDGVVLSTTVSERWRKNAAAAGRKNEFRIPDLNASRIQVGVTWHTLRRAQLNFGSLKINKGQ